jgi:hypothetical protein
VGICSSSHQDVRDTRALRREGLCRAEHPIIMSSHSCHHVSTMGALTFHSAAKETEAEACSREPEGKEETEMGSRGA